MKPLRIAVWVGVFAATLASSRAHAAWNNVFQVCCHGCKSQPSTSYFVDPCPAPCPAPCPPQPTCSTRLVERSYVQPVTMMETQTRMEPVTTYQTSYYWDSVQSYRVSCYYDPTTCSYRQCSQPVTSLQLRSRCCPVTNWVARSYSVPVTRQQVVTYYQPVTTCSSTTYDAPIPGSTQLLPPTPNGAGSGSPGVNEYRQPGAAGPGVGETREGNGMSGQRSPDGNARPLPQGPSSGTRHYSPPGSSLTPLRPVPAAPPRVQLDRIVALPKPNVEGEIVRPDQTGESGARLIFRRADRPGESESVKADNRGRFRATLASGTWDVVTQGAAGQLISHQRIEVKEHETRQVRVTNK